MAISPDRNPPSHVFHAVCCGVQSRCGVFSDVCQVGRPVASADYRLTSASPTWILLPRLLSPPFGFFFPPSPPLLLAVLLFNFLLFKGGLCPRGVVTPPSTSSILNKEPLLILLLEYFKTWLDFCFFFFLEVEARLKKKKFSFWEVEDFFRACGKNGCGNREGMQRLGRALPAHHERHEGKKKITPK